MKTSELTGHALDWAVTKCKGETAHVQFSALASSKHYFAPSKKWSQGGPIIEREGITLTACNGAWEATYRGYFGYGPTPLIAAMRCYVASKLGDEIEIPSELLS